MKLIPLAGKIHDRYFGSMNVAGFAFQIRGWEWFRLWLTPAQDYGRSKWAVTQWDTGLTVGYGNGVRGNNKREVIKKARAFLKKKGKAVALRALKKEGVTA